MSRTFFFKALAFGALLLSSIVSAHAQTTAFATTSTGNLIRFSTATPGTIVSSVAITGMQPGEVVLGIDIRPADNRIYALGSTGRLYVINPGTGTATLVANLAADPADATSPFAGLSGTSFGVDFNPVPDRLRVVSDTGQNLRINPNNGLVTTDQALNPGMPAVSASAYTNSVAGAASTTLFAIDTTADTLSTQNPPNDGTLNSVGALGINALTPAAFDILATGNVGYAALTTSGTASSLYTVDLATGAATLVGSIGAAPTLVTGVALVQQPVTATLVGSTATFTGTAVDDLFIFDQSGGLLRHNRFTAGDPGFASDFDFDPNTPGDQTLSASDPAVTVIVNAGTGNDHIMIGTPAAPKSGLAASFQVNGDVGSDALVIDDSASATGRSVTVNNGSVSGLGGSVSYGTIESLGVALGSGADTVQVNGVAETLLAAINTGGGTDVVNVVAAGIPLSSSLVLNGGAGSDTLNYSSGGVPFVLTPGPGPGQTTITREGSGNVVFAEFENAPEAALAVREVPTLSAWNVIALILLLSGMVGARLFATNRARSRRNPLA